MKDRLTGFLWADWNNPFLMKDRLDSVPWVLLDRLVNVLWKHCWLVFCERQDRLVFYELTNVLQKIDRSIFHGNNVGQIFLKIRSTSFSWKIDWPVSCESTIGPFSAKDRMTSVLWINQYSVKVLSANFLWKYCRPVFRERQIGQYFVEDRLTSVLWKPE